MLLPLMFTDISYEKWMTLLLALSSFEGNQILEIQTRNDEVFVSLFVLLKTM